MSKDNWKLFEVAVQHLHRIFLVGPPGVGKTFAAQQAAKAGKGTKQRSCINITLSEDVVLQELLGHFIPKGGEFVWHDGPLTTALRNGDLVVVNELGRASSAIKDAMLGVLDSPEVCQVVLPGCSGCSGKNGAAQVDKQGRCEVCGGTGTEIVKPGKTFAVIATSNSGIEELDPALADRFECVLVVSTPHPELLNYLDNLVRGLGTLVKKSYADESKLVSPRAALTFAKLVGAGLAGEQAGAIAFGDRSRDLLANMRLG
jgi:MoxR-like ATPase